ncbi:NYN domain-containing protein [Candidatus Parcubacteria bacterium]|nr:MAG: NYN domain-containing protein [Candidatus Parcubacteria bacterium]GIW68750.1 MAG: NYN domain-containing protein [Candidatus Parcubacteria bacterium]
MAAARHPAQRVGVFIDTQNLYHSAKHLYQTRVNFAELLKEAITQRQLVRAVAYVIRTEGEEERSFFEALSKLGIETKEKDLQVFVGGQKKADWDVGLAVDAIKLAPKLDAVVIASGDGDFVPLVHYLKMREGCQVEIISFGRSTALALKEAADIFTDMDADPRRYTLRPKTTSRPRRSGL